MGSVSVVRREASSSPNAPLLKEKRERMILHSVSGTAPSPTTSPEAAEDGVELLIDELGKIDEAMKVCSWVCVERVDGRLGWAGGFLLIR